MSSFTYPVSPWKRCKLCKTVFTNPQHFINHLRQNHCYKDGQTILCSYGPNSVCSSTPAVIRSDREYDLHVSKYHVLSVATAGETKEDIHFMTNLSQTMKEIASTNPSNRQPGQKEVMNKDNWTIYDSTLILPNILNDPTRPKREADLFTKTWGSTFVDSVPLPESVYIQDIVPEHFQTYLKYMKKRMRYRSKGFAKLKSQDPVHDKISERPFQSQYADEDGFSGLESVPKIFLQPEFNLEEPDTFNAVLPWSQLFGSNSSALTLKAIHELQENLSSHLDVVEAHIAKQIALKSETFFDVMTSHDALMLQLTELIQSVSALRRKINIIKEVNVKPSLKIVLFKVRQNRYIQLYNKLKLMTYVRETQPTIQLLLSTSEFVGALDLIYTTQDILVQELAGIHSFRHLSSQLAEMEKAISRMMETDFLRYITADLNRPPTETNVMEEDRLFAILMGMLRQSHFTFVQTFKDECYTAIDAAIKQSVIEVISEVDDNELENNTGNLTEQLQSLNSQKWMELLQSVLKKLTFLLTRISALYMIIDDVSNMNDDENVPKSIAASSSSQCNSIQVIEDKTDIRISEQDYKKLKSDLKDVICAVCDHANDGCATIFTAKAKDGSLDKLSITDFVLLTCGLEEFQGFCEGICGRQSTPLGLALQNHASRFVTRFHDERKKKLNLLLGNEQWKQADVPMEFQELVDHIVETGKVTFVKKNSSGQFLDRKPQPYILVNNEKFMVVGTVLMLLRMVIEYCQCAEDVPMLAMDLATRLAELLKTFSSKTCVLVLGAGALQVVGLKTITTKHLALTSRCLKLITYFLPQVKDHFCSKMSSKKEAIVKHFDYIYKVYCDHIDEISSKMESILSDMFENQLRQWEVKAPVPSSCFRSICKQVSKFHEVLIEVLPPEDINLIFQRVNDIFKNRLRKHLKRLEINIDGGPQHGLVTQELTFYAQKLKNLNLNSSFNVNDLWQSR